MNTIQIRFLSVTALAFLVLTGSATAQTRPPLLNALEVQQFVTRAEPADNARLAGHFTALAERYTAEAKRHTRWRRVRGEPKPQPGDGMSVHCKQLADLNTQSATELVISQLTTGTGGWCHSDAAGAGRRFEGGAGAPRPTDQSSTLWRPRRVHPTITAPSRGTS